MTVKINKPEINIREKLSEIDKPVGAAGQDMIAAETSQQQFNLIGAGRKNILINAMFEVSQRGNYQVDNGGTGWTASSPTYGVDRWYAYGNGVAVTTSTSEQTLPTGQTVLAMKCVATASSASSFLHPAQNFEVARWMEGQDFTYSCWVKTNRVGQYVRMCNTLSCWTISEEVPADGEWHFMTGTQNMGTGITLTSSAQFQPAFGGGALATGDYVEFALPQVELGRVATPFEYRSYGEELALCQRYYQLNISNTAFTNSATSCRIGISGVVQMRAQPSLTIVDATGRVEDFGIANRNLVSLASFSPGGVSGTMGGAVDATITSSSSSRPHILFAGSIGLDAEI